MRWLVPVAQLPQFAAYYASRCAAVAESDESDFDEAELLSAAEVRRHAPHAATPCSRRPPVECGGAGPAGDRARADGAQAQGARAGALAGAPCSPRYAQALLEKYVSPALREAMEGAQELVQQ